MKWPPDESEKNKSYIEFGLFEIQMTSSNKRGKHFVKHLNMQLI